MKIAPLAEVKARFSRYVEECEEGPVVVTKNGRPKAVLVAAGNEEELERLILAHTPRFTAMLKAAERRIKKDGESNTVSSGKRSTSKSRSWTPWKSTASFRIGT